MQKYSHAVARAKAIEAAELSLNSQVRVVDAAAQLGVERHIVTAVRMILDHGTPEEIEELRTGSRGLTNMVTAIRKRAGRLPRIRRSVWSNDTHDKRAFRNALWKNLSTALEAIVSMPHPAEVAEIIKTHPARRQCVDAKLLQSLSWLTEFSDVWTR